MMKRVTFLSLPILFLIGLFSFIKHDEELHQGGPDRVSFGVKIGLLPSGGITQYALFFYQGERSVGNQPIDLNHLIKICTGEWPVPRSNNFINIFEENGFTNDTLSDGTVINYIAAFDSLWKIRYDAHPYHHELGKGWSQGEIRPSLKQQSYIVERYGVRGYDQAYFSDTSFYKLLKDVMDPKWIENYKSLR